MNMHAVLAERSGSVELYSLLWFVCVAIRSSPTACGVVLPIDAPFMKVVLWHELATRVVSA